MESLHTERVTTESLKNGAQELLEDYYEERDRLAKDIETLQTRLDKTKLELRKLNKKNRNLLKVTGSHKTYDVIFYELIAENPGLMLPEIRDKVLSDPRFSQVIYALNYVRSTISILVTAKCVKIIEGQHFTNGPFVKVDTSGYTKWITSAIKQGPKTAKEIRAYVQDNHNIELAPIKMSNVLFRLLDKNMVSSNRTHKGQKNVTYTWIGD